MTLPISVRLGGRHRHDHAVALASLPADLRPSTGDAEIEVVSTDFVAVQAALAGSARALVIDDVAALDERTISLLDRAALPIHPALHLASSLAGTDAASFLEHAGLVRSRLAWGGSLEAALLEHLAGLVTVLGPLTEVRLLDQSRTHYSGSACTDNGVDVLWSGQVKAARASYELDVIGLADRLEIFGSLDGSARPLAIRQGSAQGVLQLPGIFETGLRRFWTTVVAERRGEGRAIAWRDVAPLVALVQRLVTSPSTSERGAA